MGFEHIVSAINPFHWMTMVGALLIAVVIAAPSGLSGVLEKISGSGRRMKGGRA
jgi:branched-chain amino acid transport system permease protein